MKNLHAVTVNYLPCTDTKPSRVKLHSLRHNTTKFISYASELGLTYEQGEIYLKDQGFSIIGLAENGNGYILLVNEFHNIK